MQEHQSTTNSKDSGDDASLYALSAADARTSFNDATTGGRGATQSRRRVHVHVQHVTIYKQRGTSIVPLTGSSTSRYKQGTWD